ncbi:hypothetical protein Ancab_003797 [Ancistrocladus abbreviatus]
MASSSSALPKLAVLCVFLTYISSPYGGSAHQLNETSTLNLNLVSDAEVEWPSTSNISPLFLDEIEEVHDSDSDSDFDSDSNDPESVRRSLYWRACRYYISYGALAANRIPCPPRSGRSYYTNNCYRARGPCSPLLQRLLCNYALQKMNKNRNFLAYLVNWGLGFCCMVVHLGWVLIDLTTLGNVVVFFGWELGGLSITCQWLNGSTISPWIIVVKISSRTTVILFMFDGGMRKLTGRRAGGGGEGKDGGRGRELTGGCYYWCIGKIENRAGRLSNLIWVLVVSNLLGFVNTVMVLSCNKWLGRGLSQLKLERQKRHCGTTSFKARIFCDSCSVQCCLPLVCLAVGQEPFPM